MGSDVIITTAITAIATVSYRAYLMCRLVCPVHYYITLVVAS